MSIVPFSFGGGELRVIMRDGEPWFVLADVCRVLEVSNSRDAGGRLDADERGVALIDTPGGRQEVVIISEAGLYRLVMRSDKPQAKPFQKWVTAEVLPSFRKTGGYGRQDPMALLNDLAALRRFPTSARHSRVGRGLPVVGMVSAAHESRALASLGGSEATSS